MSGTRSSAGMLVAWQVILMPFSFPTKLVLVGFSIRYWEEENIPFLLEHNCEGVAGERVEAAMEVKLGGTERWWV